MLPLDIGIGTEGTYVGAAVVKGTVVQVPGAVVVTTTVPEPEGPPNVNILADT